MHSMDSITRCIISLDKEVVTKNKWDAKLTWHGEKRRIGRRGRLVGGERKPRLSLGGSA